MKSNEGNIKMLDSLDLCKNNNLSFYSQAWSQSCEKIGPGRGGPLEAGPWRLIGEGDLARIGACTRQGRCQPEN